MQWHLDCSDAGEPGGRHKNRINGFFLKEFLFTLGSVGLLLF
jgi:hypothetical protein